MPVAQDSAGRRQLVESLRRPTVSAVSGRSRFEREHHAVFFGSRLARVRAAAGLPALQAAARRQSTRSMAFIDFERQHDLADGGRVGSHCTRRR
jgi:hypothetical protein